MISFFNAYDLDLDIELFAKSIYFHFARIQHRRLLTIPSHFCATKTKFNVHQKLII